MEEAPKNIENELKKQHKHSEQHKQSFAKILKSIGKALNSTEQRSKSMNESLTKI